MAPISLKDPNIQGITEEFVKALTGFKKSSRNFTLSVQFALSNFRFHQYLDVNSQKVERNIDGVCQKLNIHSQSEKAEILRDLCNRFLNLPLTAKSQESKTDAHYSLLLLLLTLADSPTNVDYTPLPPPQDTSEEWFDWKSYLLDGEEEEIIGLPNQQYLDWSDEEDEELELASDPAISLDHRQQASSWDQFERETENSVAERQFATSSISSQDRGWISHQIVAQYWQESINNLHHTDRSERSNCSLAGSWDSYQNGRNPLYQSNCNQTLTETQIVRETLWMLSGAQNTFVYRHVHQNGTLDVKDNIQVLHLTPEGLSILLSSFATAGQQIFSLRKFVSSVLDPETKSTQTLQAFANALTCYFEGYKALLSSIEKDIVKQDASVSLLLLQNKLRKTLDEISSLHRIYQAAFMETQETNNAQRTCRILTILYRSIIQTDGHGGAAKWKVCLLLKIFLQSVEPCFRFIDEWVTSGHVYDPHNEFFIERIQAISVDSPSFWSDGVIFRCANQPLESVVPCFLQDFVNQIFQAGKSVELIRGLGKMGELHSLRTKGSLYQEFLDQLLTALSSNPSSEKTVDHVLQDEKDGTSLIDLISDSEQIESVIDDTGDHVLKLSLMNSSLNNQNSQRSVTAEKLENICSEVFNLLKPVEVLLNECLAPLIQDSCTRASCSIIELLKTDFCLLDHLAAVRNFFLLEAGDVMHQFYVEIFNKARQHEMWQDISFLNSLIQEALQPRFPEAVERLVVSLSTSGSKNHGQLGHSLHGMALNYRAPWPVNIVIDSSCQKLYNLVFLFLLKLKQAKWSLDEFRFSDLKGDTQQTKSDPFDEDETTDPVSTSPPDQGLLHKMFVFRFKLMQFINSIHNHFMTRILHSTVLEFQEALDQAKDLDDLIKAHSSFVQKLYNRCLLSQKVGYLREVILKVLNLVLMFQTYWDNGAQHINEEKFKKIDEEFTKCSTFLVSCLENITKRGAFPHLESLAFALASTTSIPTKA